MRSNVKLEHRINGLEGRITSKTGYTFLFYVFDATTSAWCSHGGHSGLMFKYCILWPLRQTVAFRLVTAVVSWSEAKFAPNHRKWIGDGTKFADKTGQVGKFIPVLGHWAGWIEFAYENSASPGCISYKWCNWGALKL